MANYVAVRHTAPFTQPPYDPEVCEAYLALPDRRLTFDHLLAACTENAIVLPRPLERVVSAATSNKVVRIVSAHRLRAEAVAMGFVLGYPDPAEGLPRR